MTNDQLKKYKNKLIKSLIDLKTDEDRILQIPDIAKLIGIPEVDALELVRSIATEHFNIFDSLSYKMDYVARCTRRKYFRLCGHKIGGAVIISYSPLTKKPAFKEENND